MHLLEKKVLELTKKVYDLSAENQKTSAELKFFEKDAEGIKKMKLESEGFQSQKNLIKEKLNKLLNKFSEAGL